MNQADVLEAIMRKQCELQNIALEIPVKRNREEEKIESKQENLTLERKIELVEKVKKVSHEVLAEIVKIVESDCKLALEELDSERLQIKVESLDRTTFEKIWTVIEDSKPVKKSKKNN